MTKNKMLKIPYGMTNLEAIIREGYYYVDKTRFIRSLEDEGRYVVFLRPRRYGKSLTIAMLEYYYGLQYADRFEAIFGNLDIGKDPTDKRNSYFVLSLNFSSVNSDKDKVEESFNTTLLLDFRRFTLVYKNFLPAGATEEIKTFTDSNAAFKYLCSLVEGTGKKMYVVIDEYDNFANTLMSYDEGAYRDLTHGDGFFRLFFNSLKAATTGTSAVVDRMFISGVSPLTLSDVTSGFNIGRNLSLRAPYNEMVGFTEQEVRAMLQYYHDATGKFRHTVDELLDIMRPWYDNNCFSNYCVDEEHMYNSDMVLYFIQTYIQSGSKIPENMTSHKSQEDWMWIVKWICPWYRQTEKAVILRKILSEGSIFSILRKEFSLYDIYKPENLPSLLFYMGLLTFGRTSDGDERLVIPNKIAQEQLAKLLIDYL